MIKSAIAVVVVPILLYAGLCLWIYTQQRQLIYFPTQATANSLADVLHLHNAGEDLKIWYRPGVSDRALLYFGGNAENVAANIANFRTVFPDDSLYFMNYRGYGGSSGDPSEDALYSDAVALFDTVAESFDHIFVVGRSLGSGVAAHVASVRDVERLVLVTPFDSIENVVQERYYAFPVSLLLTEKYDALSRVPAIEAQVLAILAENDRVVPYERSIALVSAFPEDQLETVVLLDTGHNSVGTSPDYLTALWNFLAR